MRRKAPRRWRGRVKSALASAIMLTRDTAIAAALRRPTSRPLVLGYHRVVEHFASTAEHAMPSMLTSAAMFERHLDWLGRSFQFVTLDDIGRHLRTGEPFARPAAGITFDDGYRDVYEQAFPILRRKGIPAAVFVVTDLVGRPFWQTHDKLYHLVAKAFADWRDPRREFLDLLTRLDLPAAQMLPSRAATSTALVTTSTVLPFLSRVNAHRLLEGLEASVGNGCHDVPQTLTWPMLAEMRRAGFTIGSHTRTHASLPTETPSAVAEELEGSRRELEQHLGHPIAHFAYPGGGFTPSVVDATARAGYDFAYTACTHDDPRHPHLTIERLLLWEGSSVDVDGCFSPAILDCQSHDLWPPARTCERIHHL